MDPSDTMQVEWACVRLSNAFAYHLDRKDYDAFAALFVEDAVFLRDGERLVGRSAILDTMRRRPPNLLTRHVTTGHHFTRIAEDAADATSLNRSYFAFADGAPPAAFAPEQVVILDFEDRYVRTPAGWRFAQRLTQQVLLHDSLRPAFGLPPRAEAA